MPLPLLLPLNAQVGTLIPATLLFTLPGVALVIGFNALFAAAVPLEWRGDVAGRRNAMLSVVYIVTSLTGGLDISAKHAAASRLHPGLQHRVYRRCGEHLSP